MSDQTTKTSCCPFYATAMHRLPVKGGAEWLMTPNPGSNQCALITSAHSPCVMEVYGNAVPNWGTCVRNPEVSGDPFTRIVQTK